MRSIKVAFVALALSAATMAFATATGDPATHTVNLTNSIPDSLATDGSINVAFSAVGPGEVTGFPRLAYRTDADNTANRIIRVSVAGLPGVISGTVTFNPTSGNGISAGEVTLGTTPAALVNSIPEFTVQALKAITYTFSTSAGFTSNPIATVTYTIADQ